MRSHHTATAAPRLFPSLQLPKLELQFKDGTCLWLHQTRADPCVRCVHDMGDKLELDLRDLAPSLAQEVATAFTTDRAGVLFFTLRQQFKTADDFLRAARQVAR